MAHAAYQLPVPQLGCGSTSEDRKACARHRLIQRDKPLQVMPPAAKVPDLYGRARTHFALEVEQVLFDEGGAAVVFIAQNLRRRHTDLRRHLNTARICCAAVVRLSERQP